MHREGVRHRTTRTLVICGFSRYSEISGKSGGSEIEWFPVVVNDVNLLGQNKHPTKKTTEAVARW